MEHYLHFFDLILVDVPCSGERLFRKQENAQLTIADKSHQCFAIQPDHFIFVNSLSKALYKIIPDVPVGKIYGKKFKPDHGLSQLIGATGLTEKITLSSEEAIRYLKKTISPVP